MESKHNNQRGFTLMVAMLVSTIVIVVGLGVSSIILRQFNLAVLSRESQAAFYAADTLVECMLYWDLKGKIFDKVLDPVAPEEPNPATGFICDHTGALGDPSGDVYIYINRNPVGGGAIGEPIGCSPGGVVKYQKTYETTLTMESAKSINKPIAYASIIKSQSCAENDPFTILTKIDTNGYNSNRTGDTRKIERGLGLTY